MKIHVLVSLKCFNVDKNFALVLQLCLHVKKTMDSTYLRKKNLIKNVSLYHDTIYQQHIFLRVNFTFFVQYSLKWGLNCNC